MGYKRTSGSWEEQRAADAEEKVVKLENQLETLTRVAVSVMETLEEVQQQDFVLLKNKAVRDWWLAHRTQELNELKERLVRSRLSASEQKKTLAKTELDLAEREQEFVDLKEKLKL